MATLSYPDRSTSYGRTASESPARAGYLPHASVGATIFLWVAWALAAAFWSGSMMTAVGIMEAVTHPTGTAPTGGIDAGGVQFALMEVVGGVVVLGLAIAYGLYRYSTRDRSMDAVTEASTHALYDMVEQAGGDDEVTRSPDARKTTERDAYRAIDRDRL
jgi:hypothetical protein